MSRMQEGMKQKFSRRESIKNSKTTNFLGIRKKNEKIIVGRDKDGHKVYEIHSKLRFDALNNPITQETDINKRSIFFNQVIVVWFF
jgi:hypothetical protein